METLDAVDLEILRLLQEDGRTPNAELARRVGLTPTPTLERVRRLERMGVIRRYTAVVDPEALGKRLTIFAAVTLAHQSGAVNEFLKEIGNLPEVMECHHLTGEADYLLKVLVSDTREYQRLLLEHLTRLPGVQQIRSSVVLSTVKEETCVPIPQAGER